jgi:cell division GTPase FtsZ
MKAAPRLSASALPAVQIELLLETSIDCAKGVLFSVSGSRDLKMNEVNEVAKLIAENADQSAKIIFGTYREGRLNKGQLKVTLIATGFNGGLDVKENVLMPDFFSPGPVLENETGLEEAIKEKEEEEPLNPKLFSEETKKKGKGGKKQSEETLDTPTFLRKKRK